MQSAWRNLVKALIYYDVRLGELCNLVFAKYTAHREAFLELHLINESTSLLELSISLNNSVERSA